MVKSKFNLDIWFSSYYFFYFIKSCMHELKAELEDEGQRYLCPHAWYLCHLPVKFACTKSGGTLSNGGSGPIGRTVAGPGSVGPSG